MEAKDDKMLTLERYFESCGRDAKIHQMIVELLQASSPSPFVFFPFGGLNSVECHQGFM